MNKSTVIILTSCVLVSLYLRVILPYDAIFTEVGIKFSGNDAYYHMTLVDRMIKTFPIHMNPYTSDIPSTFFHYLLFGIIWLVSWGNPSPYLIDVIGVFFPAILGVLTIFPVYFLGKELFGRTVGLLSAALIAVLPGEFLGRSILGFTDHDILNTFLTTLAMLFLVKGIKGQGKRYGVFAGIILGLFLLTWYGALLFIFIIDLYLLIQVLINHFQRKSSKHLLWTFNSALIIATLFYHLDWTDSSRYILYASYALPAILVYGSEYLKSKPRIVFPAGIAAIGIASLLAVYLLIPSLFDSLRTSSSMFFFGTSPSEVTTSEMQPFFSPQGKFTLTLVLSSFNVSFMAFLAGLIILAVGLVRKLKPEILLVFLWCLVILIATIEHRRFASFLAVNVALVSSYVGAFLIKVFAK